MVKSIEELTTPTPVPTNSNETKIIYLITELAKQDKRIFTQPLYFGKYTNHTLLEIAIKDPSYLRWILNKVDDLQEDIRYSILKIIDILESNDSHFKQLQSIQVEQILSDNDVKFFKSLNKQILPEEVKPSLLSVVFGWVTTKVMNVYNQIMSVKFLTIFSMFMLVLSAMYFDIDGWKETYHRFDPTKVIFIIASLYLAKIAIIKILSIKQKIPSEIKQDFGKKLSYYLNYYLLRTVLSLSLLSMVIVSAVGIYSSLAVNTVGDVNVMGKNNREVQLIEDQIKLVENKIKVIQDNASNLNKTIAELPDSYKSVKITKFNEINQENEKLSKLMGEKEKLYVQRNEALNNLQVEMATKSNKSLNFTAQLVGLDLTTLLKYINLLMTFVLEITYLSLTWFVVRLHTQKEE